MVQAERVGKPMAGHVTDGVSQQHRIKAAKLLQGGHPVEQARADEVEESEDPLCGKESVSDDPHKEGRHQGPHSRAAVDEAHLTTRETQCFRRVGAHCHIPSPPDKVVEEDH